MGQLPEWCPPYNSRKLDAITGEEVYCICKKPDGGELMVGCDGCDDWFHFSCLKVSPAYKELVFSFFCPYCQAGITGPGSMSSGNLPKTIWKRKCRLQNCYTGCGDKSKYCSEEHAEKYVRDLLRRVECKGHDPASVIRQLLKAGDLDAVHQSGRRGIPTPNREDNPELYDILITGDSKLRELQEQDNNITLQQKPRVEEEIQTLDSYLQWLKSVNSKLFDSEDESAASESQKKKKKTLKRKSICGYKCLLQIPCSVDEFTVQFQQNKDEIHSICCKLRCSRHLDWAGTMQNALQFQLESLGTSSQRLSLLMKMRQDQLNGQFYEQLQRLADNQRTSPSKTN